MKKIPLWIQITFVTALLNTASAAMPLQPIPPQPTAAHLSAEVLTRFHYKHEKLDDSTSAKIFDNYLKSLDADKLFFLQTDIDQIEKARNHFDDAILGENLEIPFVIFNLYVQRATERLNYARSLLNKRFDFTLHENYQFQRKSTSWSKSTNEINELWRKRVKNDWLRLKLAGKNDKTIRETLDKRYGNSQTSLKKLKSDDVFQDFMNAYTTAIDPHTSYFGIRASEDFDISMKLSLVGIGAVLQEKDEYTTIRELVAGGPAAMSGQLKTGDRIVGVGQGITGRIVDVMGLRLDDTVAMIRGTEDTVVVLDILPAEVDTDGKHRRISLIRKKISLEKQAAKKSIIEVKDGSKIRRIGVIALPGFYQDFAARQKGDKNFRSAARDVANLLNELKHDSVESVLIDLRNNGGGSLDEAIELTGLFIDKGPVVQQRNSSGKITIESDENAGVAWEGPLGVLINRGSASASEIFAAAIQDYGRGLVIGETSFGKGTVQSVINLDELVKNSRSEYGELKMTTAQFFRINGGTTQLRGVIPDISQPTMTDMENFGESSYENALPWTQIKAADYKPAGKMTNILPKLRVSHEQRINTDREFKYMLEDISEFNLKRKNNSISLNEVERIKERKAQEARIKLREKNADVSVAKRNALLRDDGLQASERTIYADIAIEKARKEARDILLDEAVHILSDAVGLLKGNPRITASLDSLQ